MSLMAAAKASFLLSFFCILAILQSSTCDDAALQQKCAQEVTKVMNCLDYATGKVDAPSSTCCTAASALQSADAVCLCYIIQQTHDNNPTIKSLGLQFNRLLQLPTACKLKTNISDCPTLLNITKSSPDYSIFTANATSSGTASGTNTGSSEISPSKAIMNQIRLQGTIGMAVVSAIFLSFFSLGA